MSHFFENILLRSVVAKDYAEENTKIHKFTELRKFVLNCEIAESQKYGSLY